jgi:hypothetical protein
MKLAVSYNARGEILTMFDPQAAKSDFGLLQYRPAPREKHAILDVPKNFEGRSVDELSKLLRVNVRAKKAKLEPRGRGSRRK